MKDDRIRLQTALLVSKINIEALYQQSKEALEVIALSESSETKSSKYDGEDR